MGPGGPGDLRGSHSSESAEDLTLATSSWISALPIISALADLKTEGNSEPVNLWDPEPSPPPPTPQALQHSLPVRSVSFATAVCPESILYHVQPAAATTSNSNTQFHPASMQRLAYAMLHPLHA
ncbi:unnamed protein product [Rangifer tarandus platyrhynchus]|uniref:Uncharacterized protein n=1 Tax=Rangifer tarandus platyrhynchus TaxID=3082113 RepID=A0AC59Z882_RANTA